MAALCVVVLLALATLCLAARPFSEHADQLLNGFEKPSPALAECLMPTDAGYVKGTSDGDVELYFAYFEGKSVNASSPVVLWLQGGPGCASTFGMMYELGPCSVTDNGKSLSLAPNPGSWGANAGLLFVDQPYGTGYSFASDRDLIPEDVEMASASELYTALWNFFDAHPELAERPFVVAGESYGGKFVPSLTHFIIQASRQDEADAPVPHTLRHHRHLPPDTPEPNFNLAGMAVGNGLTDPIVQESVHAEVAAAFGLIDEQQKEDIEDMQDDLVSLIEDHEWADAAKLRSKIISEITESGGLGTLLDVRRLHDYDGLKAVDRFLNQSAVRLALHAKLDGNYSSCDRTVGEVMAADAMRSVAHLVPDIVDAVPCLFYQGQFDGQDGPHGNEKWLLQLDWSGERGFRHAERTLWHQNGEVVGYERRHDNLRHVVIRNAGHMAPHDQPLVVKALISSWLWDDVVPPDARSTAES